MNRWAERLRAYSPYVADALIILLAIAIEVEIAVTKVHVHKLLLAPLAVFWALPLLARRRYPLLALSAVAASIALAATIDAGPFHRLNIPFFSAIAAAVIAGAIADRRQAVIGGVLTFLTVAWVDYRDPHNHASDLLWLLVVFAGLWVAGFLFGTRTRQTHELRARAERAERDREQRAREAVAEERARIARELHDVVAHYVSVMVVQTSAVRRLLRPEQERERETLVGVESVGRQALTEMRRLIGILREQEAAGPALGPAPSIERIDDLIRQVREAGLPVEVTVEGTPVALPAGIDVSAYRILQEALTNTLKHAGPAHAEVRLRYGDDQLEVEVADDGRGYGMNGNADGHGLVGMRERVVSVCRGEFEAGRRPEGGFSVRARLPYAEVPSV